ncbi:MAG: hypothetical protein K2K19_00150, partial [Acetatifactor sp.]|nr:hypothetical protein [Acetatifactor sp.]
YVSAVIVAVALGMSACSFGPKEGTENAGTVRESETLQVENTETKPSDPESENMEPTNMESSETNAAWSNEKEDSDAVEIAQGDPLVAVVDSYEDNIIVLRDMDDEDIIYYFSTQDAEVIEGDSPIAAGDIVEITYRGVQGDREHPGMAVKVVAESMMYK